MPCRTSIAAAFAGKFSRAPDGRLTDIVRMRTTFVAGGCTRNRSKPSGMGVMSNRMERRGAGAPLIYALLTKTTLLRATTSFISIAK